MAVTRGMGGGGVEKRNGGQICGDRRSLTLVGRHAMQHTDDV